MHLWVGLQGDLIRIGFTVAGIGAVGTWWSSLNREVVSLQGGLIRIGFTVAGIGAVGTWWSGQRWPHYIITGWSDSLCIHPCINIRDTAESGASSSSVVRSRWLKDLFESADKDSSGTLTVKEVMGLMNELNVGISKKILKRMFKVRDTMY